MNRIYKNYRIEVETKFDEATGTFEASAFIFAQAATVAISYLTSCTTGHRTKELAEHAALPLGENAVNAQLELDMMDVEPG